jgi:glutathione S-transferase
MLGRGETVRLLLHEVGGDFAEIAHAPADRASVDLLPAVSPFAPPVLRHGQVYIAHSANILRFLGERHGLAPQGAAPRERVFALKRGMLDFLVNIYGVHRPLIVGGAGADAGAKAAARTIRTARTAATFQGLEQVLKRSEGPYLTGSAPSYADLMLFQMVDGMAQAFPSLVNPLQRICRRVFDLHERIAQRPRIGSYLGSAQRLAFSHMPVFAAYRALDREAAPGEGAPERMARRA